MSNEKRLWIIEARDGAWGANGICKGELVRCKDCKWACLAPQRQTATCMKNRLPFTHDYDWFCADGKRKEKDDE